MLSWKKILSAFLKVLFIPQFVFFGLVLFVCVLYGFINPSVTSLMVLRKAQGMTIKSPYFLSLKKIPRSTQNAFIYLEDHHFYDHHGVSLAAINEAYQANQKLGYPLFGGSTITQQLARTLFLTPDKSYFRKYLEAVIALIMETVLSKQRIMELYLNYIEWGPGVFGIEAASRHHFGKSFAKLGTEQIYRLAAIITNPLRYDVETMFRSRGMTARYQALMDR